MLEWPGGIDGRYVDACREISGWEDFFGFIARVTMQSSMLDDIKPGDHFRLSADTNNILRISQEMNAKSFNGNSGLIYIEVLFECLATVEHETVEKTPKLRLKRLNTIDDVNRMAYSNQSKIAVFFDDPKGHFFITDKSLESIEAARSFLDSRKGRWLIVRVVKHSLMPIPEDTDPFTDRLPIRGSYITGNGNNVSGPFLGFGYWQGMWVKTHNPSGYYSIRILERYRLIDNGMNLKAKDNREQRDAELGDFFVYEKTQDGNFRLAGAYSPAEDVCETFKKKPGLWLVGIFKDAVGMH